MPDGVLEQLQKARERLLDLNLTNRLLNYRPPKTAAVRIVGEKIDHVWRSIYEQQVAVEFLAGEQHGGRLSGQVPGDEADDGTRSDLPEFPADEDAGTATKRHSARFLQTSHEGPHLQTRLLRLFHLSQTAVEELGINVLFLAMGFVNWMPPSQNDLVRAPVFLLPVTLERTSARQRFNLRSNGDEPVLNPCLVRKLQRDFRIELASEPDNWADFGYEGYIASVRRAIREQKQWKVTDDIYLGIFSFTKYLMYLDLDGGRWDENNNLRNNPLIRAMCGERTSLATSGSILPRPEELDRREDPAQVFQVVDADSSQQAAIAAVKNGTSLVIQGPPGTGKSQTITNIVAECLSIGKTVLFVSQKKAALEVVQSRLNTVGLGDFCLELHSTKAHRATMLSELDRVLSLKPSPGPANDHKIERLKQIRARLNSYVHDLYQPIGETGLTPYAAIGQYTQLGSLPDLAAALPGVETWKKEDIAYYKDLIKGLSQHLKDVWPPAEHPWHGSRLTSLPDDILQNIKLLLRPIPKELKDLNARAQALSGILGLAGPTTVAAAHAYTSVARLILESTSTSLELIGDDRWDSAPPQTEELLRQIKSYDCTRTFLKDRYQFPQADSVDWPKILDRAARYPGTGRFLMPGFWRDRSLLRRVSAPSYHPSHKQRIADLKQLADTQRLGKEIRQREDIGRKYFGAAWQGPDTSLAELLRTGNWAIKARRFVRKGLLVPKGRELCLSGKDRTALKTASDELMAALTSVQTTLDKLCALAALKEPGWFLTPMTEQPIASLCSRTAAMNERLESLRTWCQYQEALQRCEKSPMASFACQAGCEKLKPDLYEGAFEKRMLTVLLNVMDKREQLRTFSARNHEDLALEFARLDAEILCENRRTLYKRLAERRPSFKAAKSSILGILQSEIRRKRGGKSIRRILKEAGEVVQWIKPCFMMSPLSVAQYLEPNGIKFDVVVFDEASQVEPSDALGAIARGTQLVLVGDRKQLPPTNFFTSLSSEDQTTQEGEAALTDMESILDRGESVLPTIALRWHYRSKHESLITFSNAEFYNNDLVVFPSSHSGREKLGVSLRYDPADLYDRAKSRTNREQAKKIAAAVVEHFRNTPDKSLAVATFSVAQKQAIDDEIEKLRRADATLERFFKRDNPEHFFVKNLETVQGDERDVIFLSVGHGRANAGERVGSSISNLNGEDGWRRLNVLITRARERYVVFSSILAGDMDLSGTTARGVHAFKRYLQFAQFGKVPETETSDGESGSPFEEAVYAALSERGCKLRKQVGCVGYSIDLAVVDPLQPGRYLLGIECDGATYHSSATARDRDRLRQQVLEGLGWRIHRIWSTEWFRRPQAELARALEAIEKARNGQLKPRFAEIGAVVSKPTVVATEGTAAPSDASPPVATRPYVYYKARSTRRSDDFYTDPLSELVEIVGQVVAVEGPIHQEEFYRRVATQYEMGRLGNRVVEKIAQSVKQALAGRIIVRRQEFLWSPTVTTPLIRKRDDPFNRNMDLVSPEEIALVIQALVRAQHGIGREDLTNQTARALGFSPSGGRTKEQIDKVIESEIERNALKVYDLGQLHSTVENLAGDTFAPPNPTPQNASTDVP